MPSLRIGIAPCLQHAPPHKADARGESRLYSEESTVDWVRSGGVVPLILPRPGDGVDASDIIACVDGLVLHGGSDVAPESYGSKPERPEWAGDRVRDIYELALVQAALAGGAPIFAICRGAQLLNVARDGTLHQDIPGHLRWLATAPDAPAGSEADVDLDLMHELEIVPGSWLAHWYRRVDVSEQRVNSIHHQAIRGLGRGLVVEARAPDGTIEAFRLEDGAPGETGAWAYAVQWHPEYMHPARDRGGLPPKVLLDAFIEAVGERRARRRVG